MKTHDEIKEMIAGFILGELTKEQASEVQEHLSDCPECRQEVEQMKLVLRCSDHMSGLAADENMCADAKSSVFCALKNEDNNTTVSRPGVVRISERKNIMQSRSMRVAVAAVVILGVFIGLNMLGISPDGSSVAWAELAERVEQAKTVIYRVHATMKRLPGLPEDKVIEMEQVMKVSSDYGMRMDMHMDGKEISQTYILFAEKTILSIMPEQKKFIRMALTGELLEKTRKESYDPKEMVAQFMGTEYVELGRSEIDGVEVEGIETNDPKVIGGMFGNFAARMWVEVETGLPVLMEMKFSGDDGSMDSVIVIDGFEWGAEIDASEFAHVIPADYELIADVKMPEMNEDSAVKGLRAIVEMTGGRYPKSLNIMDLTKEVSEFTVEKMKKEREARQEAVAAAIAAGIDPNTIQEAQPEKEAIQEMIDEQMTIQGAAMFYMHLVTEDKDPAYFGERVTSEDTDAVLMRWLNDTGGYRVIYGDLSIGDLSGEELGELEAELAEPVVQ